MRWLFFVAAMVAVAAVPSSGPSRSDVLPPTTECKAPSRRVRKPPLVSTPPTQATQLPTSKDGAEAGGRATAMPSPDPIMQWLRIATERVRGSPHAGRVLDAGAGVSSLRWLQTLSTDAIVAVTASEGMRDDVATAAGSDVRVTVVTHNWAGGDAHAIVYEADGLRTSPNPNEAGRTRGNPLISDDGTPRAFDTVLADYLFGALEYFSPFSEAKVMDEVVRRVDPDSGVLLVVGRQPLPFPARVGDSGARVFDSLPWAARIVLDTERLRDAAMLLGHQRHYRELPCAWVERELRSRGLYVRAVSAFSIVHTTVGVERQLRWAEREAVRVADGDLAQSLLDRAARLRRAAKACPELNGSGFALGVNYVLVATRGSDENDDIGAGRLGHTTCNDALGAIGTGGHESDL